MDFHSDTTTGGVRERRYALDDVPGVLVTPAGAQAPGPLVLAAHGGGRSATHPTTLAQAHHYASAYGLSVLTLDAPGHGGRPAPARMGAAIATMRTAMATGSPAAAIAQVHAELVATAVPEWRAALDAVLATGHARTPAGFIGLSMGAALGVPLLAAEPRIAAAVIGTAGLIGLADHRALTEQAARVTAAVQLVVQWDDELVERGDALALFTAISSKEKTLHANPGAAKEVPAAERESAARFLAHHLLDTEATTTLDPPLDHRLP